MFFNIQWRYILSFPLICLASHNILQIRMVVRVDIKSCIFLLHHLLNLWSYTGWYFVKLKKKTQGYIFFILSLHSDSLSPKHWVSLYACVETGKALRPEGACDSGVSHWYHGPCSHYILCISQGIVRSRSQILTTPRVEGVSLEGNGPLLLII